MEECEEAFQDLKKYLVSSPKLSCPKFGEDLYMYLTVSEHADFIAEFTPIKGGLGGIYNVVARP